MKTFISSIVLFIACLVGLTACSGDNEYNNEIPGPIQEFISEYFAGEAVSSYSTNGDTYRVKLKSDCAISFDSRYRWVTVNGYGSTLPQMFLFDQMPPSLYSYLQETDNVNEVYSVTRDTAVYTVNLQDDTITYDIDSGTIHGE